MRMCVFNCARTKMAWEMSHKLLVAGIVLFFLGMSTIVFKPYEYIFEKISILYPDGIVYGFWHRPDEHLMAKVYLFNITNKDAFLAGKEKLKLQEIGPYVYREDAIHHNMTFNDDGTVSSSPRYTLHWIPELNERKESDVLVLPNLPMLLFCSKFWYLNIALNKFVQQTNSFPIIEQTVKEFLFGYDNTFIQLGNKLLPFWIKFDKIGILDRLYDHEGDVATSFTGEVDRRMTGLFATYNEQSYLPFWDAPCNNIVGSSDGKKFGNGIKANETLQFYRKGLCRAFQLRSVNSETVDIDNIPSLHYKAEENLFDNGKFNERNKCFCKSTPCLPHTIHEISDCFYGFSIGISFPHFLNGSDALREPFEGLNPNLEQHDTYVYINPDLGYITNGSVKLQVNAILGDLSGILGSERFSNMILPLAWSNFHLDRIAPNMNILLMLGVKVLPALETILSYSFMIVGFATAIYQARKLIQSQFDFGLAQRETKMETERKDQTNNAFNSAQIEQLDLLLKTA